MASKKPALVSKLPLLVIELLGLAVSSYLFMVSTKLIGDGHLPCMRSKWISCHSAVQGSFSHVGPFSVAAMGCIYYLLQLMLTTGLRDRSAQLMKLLLIAGGLFFVAWLRSIEFIYLKKICPWCWGIAAITLVHAGLLWSLAVPPLPRFRPLAIAGTIFGGFIVLVGLVTLAELGVKTGVRLQRQGYSELYPEGSAEQEDAETSKTSVKKTSSTKVVEKDTRSTPSAKPSPTPRVTAQQTPTLLKGPPATPDPQVAGLPTPVATATPAVTPKPVAQMDPEPELDDSPDVRVLRNSGWRHAGSGDSVIKAVKAKPPVLLLAYNPTCPDCEKLIMKVLNTEEIKKLPVTKIAIQEDMVNGQINAWVKEFPSMYLIDATGSQVWTKVGSSITPQEMSSQILNAIGSGQ